MVIKTKQSEGLGAGFILLQAALWGIFPVVVQSVRIVPPLTFAALTTIVAGFGIGVYAVITGHLAELKNRHAWPPLLLVTLFIIVIPYSLFFIGARYTSGLNAAVLPLSEIIFTAIIAPLFGEARTHLKLLGSLGILGGGLLLLYHPEAPLIASIGDVLVIGSTLAYPIGNFFSKKSLNVVSPSIIVFVRCLLGGLCIGAIAFVAESQAGLLPAIKTNLALILFTGLAVIGFSKILWYEGLKRLDITKAVSLAMTYPFFSLLLLVTRGEVISMKEWIGFALMILGVLVTVAQPSIAAHRTKYAPQATLRDNDNPLQ